MTVLVVDDDAATRELIGEILRPHHQVLFAQNGLEAFQWTQRGHIDLILMDILMPLFSGFWFCNAFKRKRSTANIPIVIVSGMLNDENVEKARLVGACATVKKPFRCDELLEVVEKNATH